MTIEELIRLIRQELNLMDEGVISGGVAASWIFHYGQEYRKYKGIE